MSREDERINCKKCGDDTNHCPSEFPPEWDGYCPECAFMGALDGTLPRCSVEALISQIEGCLRRQGLNVDIHLVPGDLIAGAWGKVSEDDDGASYIVRQCLN